MTSALTGTPLAPSSVLYTAGHIPALRQKDDTTKDGEQEWRWHFLKEVISIKAA